MDPRISYALKAVDLPPCYFSDYTPRINAELNPGEGFEKLSTAKFIKIRKASEKILNLNADISRKNFYAPYAAFAFPAFICAVACFAASFFISGAFCTIVFCILSEHVIKPLETTKKELSQCEEQYIKTITKHIHALSLTQILQDILEETQPPLSTRDKYYMKLTVSLYIAMFHDSFLPKIPNFPQTPDQIKAGYENGTSKRDSLIAYYTAHRLEDEANLGEL